MKTAGEELEQDRLALARANEVQKMNSPAQLIQGHTEKAVRKLAESLDPTKQDRFWKWYKETKYHLQGTKLVEQKIELLNAEVKSQAYRDLHKLPLTMVKPGKK